MKLILASQSPRRRDLLALTGFSFTVQPTHTDESRNPGEGAHDYARRLSLEKAQAAAVDAAADAVIVAADTIVIDGADALDNTAKAVLEKPADADEARRMLRSLRGQVHEVCTAITVLDTRSGEAITELASSPVRMRNYTDEEISVYIDSGDPFDKAGSYAIQHEGFHPAEGFDHCFANVMGLPMCHLTRVLREMGIEPTQNVPRSCQTALDYDCPVFETILKGGE